MRKDLEKVDGRWIVPTGNVVAVGYINMGDDYDIILADQYKDICTGETFAKERDVELYNIIGETKWHLVKHDDVMPEYKHIRKNAKKRRRADRVYQFTGIYWGDEYPEGRILGKNRFLRRRMNPTQQQIKEFTEDWLPF